MKKLFDDQVKKSFYNVSKIPKSNGTKFRWIFKATEPVTYLHDRFYAAHKNLMFSGDKAETSSQLSVLNRGSHTRHTHLESSFRTVLAAEAALKRQTWYDATKFLSGTKAIQTRISNANAGVCNVFPSEIIGGMRKRHITEIVREAYDAGTVFKTDIVGFFKNTKTPVLKKVLVYAAKKAYLHELSEILFTTHGHARPVIASLSPDVLEFDKAIDTDAYTVSVPQSLQGDVSEHCKTFTAGDYCLTGLMKRYIGVPIAINSCISMLKHLYVIKILLADNNALKAITKALLQEILKSEYGILDEEALPEQLLSLAPSHASVSALKSELSGIIAQINKGVTAIHSHIMVASGRNQGGNLTEVSHRGPHRPFNNGYYNSNWHTSKSICMTLALNIDDEAVFPIDVHSMSPAVTSANSLALGLIPRAGNLPQMVYAEQRSEHTWPVIHGAVNTSDGETGCVLVAKAGDTTKGTACLPGYLTLENNVPVIGLAQVVGGMIAKADLKTAAKALHNMQTGTDKILGIARKDNGTYKQLLINNQKPVFTKDNAGVCNYKYKGKDKVCYVANDAVYLDIIEEPIRAARLSDRIRSLEAQLVPYNNSGATMAGDSSSVFLKDLGNSALLHYAQTTCYKSDLMHLLNPYGGLPILMLDAEGNVEKYALLPSDVGYVLTHTDEPLVFKLSGLEECNRILANPIPADTYGGFMSISALSLNPESYTGLIMLVDGKAIAMPLQQRHLEANEIDIRAEYENGNFVILKETRENHSRKVAKCIEAMYEYALDLYTTHRASLPEGAITSLLLSNYVLAYLVDSIRHDISALNGKIFTYVDDVSIMFKALLSFDDKRKVYKIVKQALNMLGLRIANDKTKFITGTRKRELFGIGFTKYTGPVPGVTIRLKRCDRKLLRNTVHNAIKFVNAYKNWLTTTKAIAPTETYVSENYPKGYASNSHLKAPRIINKINGKLAWGVAVSREKYAPLKAEFNEKFVNVFRNEIYPLIKEYSVGLINMADMSSRSAMDDVDALFSI